VAREQIAESGKKPMAPSFIVDTGSQRVEDVLDEPKSKKLL